MSADESRTAPLPQLHSQEMTVDEILAQVAALGAVFRQRVEEMDKMLAAVEFQLAGRIGIAGVESDLADCQSRPAELLEMMIRIRASAEADGTALGGTSPKL